MFIYFFILVICSIVGIGIPGLFIGKVVYNYHMDRKWKNSLKSKKKKNIHMNKHINKEKKRISVKDIKDNIGEGILFIAITAIIVLADVGGVNYYLDIPNIITHNYKAANGIVKKVKQGKGIGYDYVFVGKNEYYIEDQDSVNNGDKVTVWYLPNTKLIRIIKSFNGKAVSKVCVKIPN